MHTSKSKFVIFSAIVSLLLTSCSTSPKELEVLFRDRTEKNNVGEEFSVSLNSDIAKSGEFEELTVLSLSSDLKNGDVFSLEFFGGIEGSLEFEVVTSPDEPRVVVEVYDNSIDILKDDWLTLSGKPIKRNFIDEDAGYKNLLRGSLTSLQSFGKASNDAADENMPTSSDSIKKFNSYFKARLESLNVYIFALEDFVTQYPKFSVQGEKLLSIIREIESLTGLVSVASETNKLNDAIEKLNAQLPLREDAEFRLSSEVDKFLNG